MSLVFAIVLSLSVCVSISQWACLKMLLAFMLPDCSEEKLMFVLATVFCSRVLVSCIDYDGHNMSHAAAQLDPSDSRHARSMASTSI